MENGAIVCNTSRWPLLIDPQLQGVQWIQKREAANGLVVVQTTDAGWIDTVRDNVWVGMRSICSVCMYEVLYRVLLVGAIHTRKCICRHSSTPLHTPPPPPPHFHTSTLHTHHSHNQVVRCIEEGKSLLIENLPEALDPSLEPIIARRITRKGRTMLLRLGAQEVQYNPGFRLYLATKLSNPHYPPEVAAQTTLINFCVTQRGLEEQLLAMVCWGGVVVVVWWWFGVSLVWV